MEGFGQTETTLTLANLLHMNPKPGSMGMPSPQYKIKLITADGRLAATAKKAKSASIFRKARLSDFSADITTTKKRQKR